MQNMENIIVNRLLLLITTNPSVEKKKLADIYRNQYLPIADKDIEKCLSYLLSQRLVVAFKDRRHVASWWEAKVVEQSLEIVQNNINSSTRQLFDIYIEQFPKIDIVVFQKLLHTLRNEGRIALVHSPAPSHWVLASNHQIQSEQKIEAGVLLQCA
jgi:hypothetical protein